MIENVDDVFSEHKYIKYKSSFVFFLKIPNHTFAEMIYTIVEGGESSGGTDPSLLTLIT